MKFPFFHTITTHSHFSPLFCTNHNRPTCPKPPPPPRWVRMDSSLSSSSPSTSSSSSSSSKKDKIVVIMGATGCGKTRLSIDLSLCFQSEIINSDKMQVYNGLDITTNKITQQERRGVPHHLLGDFDPNYSEFSPSDFRLNASLAISDILSRQKLPLLVGGSNSFIHALLVDRFNPDFNVFDFQEPVSLISTHLRFNCCFIWLDVSFPVLCDYLCKRVDEMLDSGMFEELSEYYDSVNPASQPGLRRAIGVPEFDRYFKKYPPGYQGEWDSVRRGVYEEAMRMIKENTCQLAKRQIMKIMRLKKAGWDVQRVDATEAFRQVMEVTTSDYDDDDDDDDEDDYVDYNNNNNNNNNSSSNINSININNSKWKKRKRKKKKKKWMEIWERQVMKPSMKIVNHFLDE